MRFTWFVVAALVCGGFSAPFGARAQQPSWTETEDVSLEFVGDPDLTLYRADSAAAIVVAGAGGTAYGMARGYERLCSAPCRLQLEPGFHTLAISRGTGPPVEVEGGVRVDGPAVLEGSYESRSTVRTAGWVTMLASVVAGTALMLVPIFDYDPSYGDGSSNSFDFTPIIVGGAIMSVGAIVGMILALQSDEVDVGVRPTP